MISAEPAESRVASRARARRARLRAGKDEADLDYRMLAAPSGVLSRLE
jgi:hypothetical protein